MLATQTTGNLWFALPRIMVPPGGVDRLAFLMMSHRGLIELRSGTDQPLIRADVRREGRSLFEGAQAEAVADWVPTYRGAINGIRVTLTWLAPLDDRGVIGRLEATNTGATAAEVELVFELRWGATLVATYESEPLDGRLSLDPNAWGDGISLAWVTSRTELALGVGRPAEGGSWHLRFVRPDGSVAWEGEPTTGDRRRHGPGVAAELHLRRRVALAPGESVVFELHISVARDTKAACFDTRYLREQGWERLYTRTLERLAALNRNVPAPLAADPQLGPLARRNRLFCYFYSLGRTLDTEELAPVTSRSSDYYVSAAYWDRDSLLWSFPTILDMDSGTAAEMLRVAFGRQGGNIGVHSRFIDGSMYEPGFELDELVAPLIALERYIDATGDETIIEQAGVAARLPRIEHELRRRRHPTLPLVATEYLPTDDLDPHPYCIYDNVLLWRGLGTLARVLRRLGRGADADRYVQWRDALRAAIFDHGVARVDGQRLFAWSTDLAGNFRLYDEPPGSLLLLPWHGFCHPADPIWQATLAWIYSSRNEHYFAEWDEIGCKHAPHPWILAVANSLLVPQRREPALRLLRRARMDDGLACESIDEHTGVVRTGRHFATCAGFLTHALCEAHRAGAVGRDAVGPKG